MEDLAAYIFSKGGQVVNEALMNAPRLYDLFHVHLFWHFAQL
jgi:hypothetical protein